MGDLSGRLLALKWKMRHHFATLIGDPTSFFGLLYGCVIVVWLSYLAHSSLHVPPGGFCQDAPRTWLTSAGVNTSVLPVSVLPVRAAQSVPTRAGRGRALRWIHRCSRRSRRSFAR